MTMDGVPGDDPHRRSKTCTVIGGHGFVGRSLVSRLLRLGGWIVRVADSAQSLQLDKDSESDRLLHDALASGHASYHIVDVRDKSQIAEAIEGSYVVFYMGSACLDAHDFYTCYKVIVQGARNVINVCRESHVRQLIYNSSADVVFNGSQDLHDADESLMCPWKFESLLIDFKAQADALIRFANSSDSLLTCVLRPSSVFGPDDPEFVPSIVDIAKCGYAKFIIGNGENMSDFTYVENVAHAHICAAEALDSRAEFVAGKGFFITNFKPMKFWDFVSDILEGLGYPRPSIRLPIQLAWYNVALLKWTSEKMGSRVDGYSATVPHMLQLASRTRTFNCSAAKKHIGYSPVISLEDGLAATLESFSHSTKSSSFSRYDHLSDQSKADKLLGGGTVADILLWRDEKKTFTYFIFLNMLFYWFLFSGRTFTSSSALLLLLVAFGLYGYGIIPANIFGFAIKRMPASCFEISELAMRDLSRTMTYAWNCSARNIKSLAKAQDWNKFRKIVVWLYLLKWIVSCSLATVVFVVLSFSFTGFFVYEQYELELDQLAWLLLSCVRGLKEVVMENLPASLTTFLHNRAMSSQQRKYI